MSDLPAGWRVLPISEVLARLPTGKVLQQGWSPQCESVPAGASEWGVLKTTAIQPGWFDDAHHKRLPDSMTPRPSLEVKAGDLLMTNAGPRSRCAVPCLVRQTRPRLMLSGKIYRFRAKVEVIDPRFIELYLLSADAQLALDKMKTGISDSGLNLTNGRFSTLPVVVPPIEEQQRIVHVLEDHLSRLDAAGIYLAASAKRLRALDAAWLNSRIRPTAELVSVGDVTTGIKGGWSRSRSHLAAASDGVPYIKMDNILARGGLDLERVQHVTGNASDIERFRLEAGDLLFNSKNSAELVGKSGVVPVHAQGWTYNENIMRIRFQDHVLSEFAAVWFQTPRFRASVSAQVSASTNVAAIYMRQLNALPFWCPSLEQQRQLVADCRDHRIGIVRAEQEITDACQRAGALRRALLGAAFSGQLTGHSSDVERAEELADA